MLLPDDAAVVAADPALPGLGHVLDAGALLDRLVPTVRDPANRPTGGTVDYLRYKPGCSVVAGLVLETPAGPVRAFAASWSPQGTAKLHKLRAYGATDRYGFGVAVDEELNLLLGAATSDRALPGLREVLAHPRRILPRSHREDPVLPLRYKPHRRWVGVATHAGEPSVLVKVHRPGTARHHVHAARALVAAGIPVPAPVKWKGRDGLVSYRFLRGCPLDQGGADGDALAEVGRLLARVHAVPAWPQARWSDPAGELDAAARAVAAIRPGAAPAACEVAAAVAAQLRRHPGSRPTVVHGDFSADQVLLGDAGVALVDLDRAGLGPPEEDLASWLAAEVVAGRAPAGADPVPALGMVLEGYLAAGGPARADALGPHVAAALLRRAAEPFRVRAPGWGDAVDGLVRAAAGCLAVAR